MAEQVEQGTGEGNENDRDHPRGFVTAEHAFAGGNIIKDDAGENPVENAKKHQLQYPLYRQSRDSLSTARLGLL